MSWPPPCLDHQWNEIHHYDDEGNHYCPTGFELCSQCGEVRKAEGSCSLWGSKT